jgi:hypothetical protein
LWPRERKEKEEDYGQTKDKGTMKGGEEAETGRKSWQGNEFPFFPQHPHTHETGNGSSPCQEGSQGGGDVLCTNNRKYILQRLKNIISAKRRGEGEGICLMVGGGYLWVDVGAGKVGGQQGCQAAIVLAICL